VFALVGALGLLHLAQQAFISSTVSLRLARTALWQASVASSSFWRSASTREPP
jgi:hypothetical protein